MTKMHLDADAVFDSSDISPVDRVEQPAQKASFSDTPERLHNDLTHQLENQFKEGLYSHQAEGIERILREDHLCVATPTGSGKSLLYMAGTIHRLLTDGGTALALYPAKALIHDQQKKWEDLARPLDISVQYIHGGVSRDDRGSILHTNDVILMTPDVCHAWLMNYHDQDLLRTFLNTLQVVILDEGHVYEGVFGTNMAYMLRRLRALAAPFQTIMSTATLGNPLDFFERMTGQTACLLGPEDDASHVPAKTIHLLEQGTFKKKVHLMNELVQARMGQFLAFADSRKMVEQLVASLNRENPFQAADDVDDEANPPPEDLELAADQPVLPYRAGYENDDRETIQTSFEAGNLSGVVATSALELGLDIGGIDAGVLLGIPPSRKAFHQRIGRIGRTDHGHIFLFDGDGFIREEWGSLQAYINAELEPNWTYHENQYIQFTNALCAADELESLPNAPPVDKIEAFDTLPDTFTDYIKNELEPKHAVSPELYPLKQRAEGGAHYEFPIRTGMEKQFSVQGPQQQYMGNLTFSQVLREAYPGAVYYYMARPYRVYQLNYQKEKIKVKNEKHYTTSPKLQTMGFPEFQGGIHEAYESDDGFVVESDLQISQRVLGFQEQRGSTSEEFLYEAGSDYRQKPLTRFYETTGVCWWFRNAPSLLSQGIAEYIRQAYSLKFGVKQRELGIGFFYADNIPFVEDEEVKGLLVFDRAQGSLRLTKRLAGHFYSVVQRARDLAAGTEDSDFMAALRALEDFSEALMPRSAGSYGLDFPEVDDEDWTTIIAPGEPAILKTTNETEEIIVEDYRYTPQGLLYELETEWGGRTRMFPEDRIRAINGRTQLMKVNLVTGEEKSLEELQDDNSQIN